MARIGVIGTGSWGTAIGLLLHGNGHSIQMWDKNRELVDALRSERTNRLYLPDVQIPESIAFPETLPELCEGIDGLIVAIPSHGVRAVLSELPALEPVPITVSLVKGIENETLLRVSQILAEKLPTDESRYFRDQAMRRR